RTNSTPGMCTAIHAEKSLLRARMRGEARATDASVVTSSLRSCAALLAMSVALSCSSSERHERPSDKLAGALGSNDVSILFPLPAPDRIDGLLSATDEGAHGQILPWSTFTLAPDLIAKADAADTYAALRVVSARVDPCFPSLVGAPSASCRFQVRLVLQPLFEQAGELAAADAALHLFYDSSASELVELLADLLTLRANQPAESLLAPLT